MTDSAQPTNHKTLAIVAIVCLIIVAVVAGYSIDKKNSQLAEAQKEIAELKPLANKARTLPIDFRIDRHAISAGYTLYTINRSRDSLRFHLTVNGARAFNPVIDGGKQWTLRGLAMGDKVEVTSDGYDARTVNIQ